MKLVSFVNVRNEIERFELSICQMKLTRMKCHDFKKKGGVPSPSSCIGQLNLRQPYFVSTPLHADCDLGLLLHEVSRPTLGTECLRKMHELERWNLYLIERA